MVYNQVQTTGYCKNNPARKHLKRPFRILEKERKIIWTDKTQINMYKNDGKTKVWEDEKQFMIRSIP